MSNELAPFETRPMIEHDPYFQAYRVEKQRENKEIRDTQRILITMPYGIGDAVYIGLAATDQIAKGDKHKTRQVDILCNQLQAELFSCDPRIRSVIVAEKELFPTPSKKTWHKTFAIDPKAQGLLQFLQAQHYDFVFPGNVAFRFNHQLGARVMYPSLRSVIKDYLTIRSFGDAPARRRVRAIIQKSLGKVVPDSNLEEEIPLYIHSTYVMRAKEQLVMVKEKAGVDAEKAKLLIIAPDTASGTTRPPTTLLSEGLAPILEKFPNIIIYVLPSFTDTEASQRLVDSLSPKFGSRIQYMSSEPPPSLLFVTALIDQADALITGDTGTMHLAVAKKVISDYQNKEYQPQNKCKIIAVFGGTNPGLYGYRQTKIIGRGRKDQQRLRPGFLKEGYDPQETNFFDHIPPHELTEAIEEQIST